MAILNGQTPDATEVNKVILRSGILALANNQKVKFDSSDLPFGVSDAFIDSLADQDYLVDGIADDSASDYTNTTCPADNEDIIHLDYDKTRWVTYRAYNAKLLDGFDDGSINTNIWTTATAGTGTATEGSGALNLNSGNSSASAISDGVSGIDFKTFSGDSEFVIHFASQSATSSGATIKYQISNGSTHVDVHSRTATASPPDQWQDTFKVKIDKSAEEAFLSLNGAAFGGAIDISSVTTNWYLRIVVTASAGSTMNAQTYFVGYVDGDGSTVDYVTASKTFGSTKTAGILTWDYSDDDSDVSGNLSANGGSNYTTATKNVWTTIGTSGTSGKLKLTMTTPSTIDATSSSSDIHELKAVGAYFDG